MTLVLLLLLYEDWYIGHKGKIYFLTSENPISTAKTIDMYDYIKPTQRDFF